MNVSLTDKQRKYIDEKVKSGDYMNASEVVREALRAHEINDQKLDNLRTEIMKGWDGSLSSKNMKDILQAKMLKYNMKEQ